MIKVGPDESIEINFQQTTKHWEIGELELVILLVFQSPTCLKLTMRKQRTACCRQVFTPNNPSDECNGDVTTAIHSSSILNLEANRPGRWFECADWD